MTRILCAILLATTIIGCSTSKRTYDITIRNDLDKPVMIWLTKDGPPSEEKWLPPEEFIRMKNIDELISPGVIVPPGKTASTGPVTGSFEAKTNGILRVYVGETSYAGILRQNGRIDLKLVPGVNNLILRDKNGQPIAEPAKP